VRPRVADAQLADTDGLRGRAGATRPCCENSLYVLTARERAARPTARPRESATQQRSLMTCWVAIPAGALRPQESAVLVRPLRLSTFGARRAASRRQLWALGPSQFASVNLKTIPPPPAKAFAARSGRQTGDPCRTARRRMARAPFALSRPATCRCGPLIAQPRAATEDAKCRSQWCSPSASPTRRPQSHNSTRRKRFRRERHAPSSASTSSRRTGTGCACSARRGSSPSPAAGPARGTPVGLRPVPSPRPGCARRRRPGLPRRCAR